MLSEQKRKYHREWYSRNKESRKAVNRANLQRIKKWFRALKSTLRCGQCGESHSACLDFHHRNPEEKFREVALMVLRCFRIETILEEIEKCDVLCANCHRKLHYHVGG